MRGGAAIAVRAREGAGEAPLLMTISAAALRACGATPHPTPAKLALLAKPSYPSPARGEGGSVRDRGHAVGGRRVARALAAHHAVDHHHADARQVALAHGIEQVAAGAVLRLVHEYEVRRAARLQQSAVEVADARGVAGREAEHLLRRQVAEARQHGDDAQDAERLDARAGR